ncbi:MAG TPA: Uma2 family endonuclease [Candidatus Wunengus sp. YC64]|uniref:Uma2 family endonuclease n=1 Tax=Candidatus Wunengus sp. YC64 TaxID=3367700 RepID=UPI00402A1AE3
MTVVTDKRRYTYKDYLNMSDDKRYELIGGCLMMAPAPIPYHQWISKNIEYEIERFVREKKLGKVFDAPCDVYLDEENVVQPDILFVSEERTHIIGKTHIQAAPDLAVEILSESTAYTDLMKKKRLYARFGVKEYGIVDPDGKTIELHCLKEGVFVLFKSFPENDELESPLLPGLKIKLSPVFAFL